MAVHVSSRWFVGAERHRPRSAVYDIDQTQVGQDHASVLKKRKQVKCDIAIHGGAAVTCYRYKQSVELDQQCRTGVECAERAERTEHESRAKCACHSSVLCKWRQLSMCRSVKMPGCRRRRDSATRLSSAIADP